MLFLICYQAILFRCRPFAKLQVLLIDNDRKAVGEAAAVLESAVPSLR